MGICVGAKATWMGVQVLGRSIARCFHKGHVFVKDVKLLLDLLLLSQAIYGDGDGDGESEGEGEGEGEAIILPLLLIPRRDQ